MKNNKKIMISVLVISILVLIFSLTYIFLINKTSDKTLLMKSFEEISNVIESNLPSKEINNFQFKFFNELPILFISKSPNIGYVLNDTHYIDHNDKQKVLFLFHQKLFPLSF